MLRTILDEETRFTPFASAAIMLLVLATGCLNDDNLIPGVRYDGILNNGEELVDCGGSICPPCDPCENGQHDAPGETWVDCGGECDPCDPSFNGVQNPGESASTAVATRVWHAVSWRWLVERPEQGVDCGGPTGAAYHAATI